MSHEETEEIERQLNNFNMNHLIKMIKLSDKKLQKTDQKNVFLFTGNIVNGGRCLVVIISLRFDSKISSISYPDQLSKKYDHEIPPYSFSTKKHDWPCKVLEEIERTTISHHKGLYK